MNGATLRAGAAGFLALTISACGNYSLPVETPPIAGTGEAFAVKSCDELFSQRVQPRMEFCRNCHVPGGVADVEDGRLFMLSADPSKDFANLRAAWENLGRNDSGSSRILKMPSGTDTRSHSGGTPWPAGSDAYREMEAQLLGFLNPQACVLSGLGNTPPELPLLGSQRGGHLWFDFCEGKVDSATLPPDPRSLVQPGVNQDKAVYFNTWWKDCHVNPELVHERPHPKTCGELRESTARGAVLMEGNGAIGAGYSFAGNEPNGYLATPASDYNRLWQAWGMSARPDNFDELVAERYGVGFSLERNPYPLPGEDPNQTDGGSGRLPTGFTQTRNHDGSWSGLVTTNCQGCHSTIVGTPADAPGLGFLYGAGGNLYEPGVAARDFGFLGSPAVLVDRLGLAGRTRGTNNAQFANIVAAAGIQNADQARDVLTNGTTGSGDTPAWWNVGHRPLKFSDGYAAADAVRVDMALFTPLLDKKPVPSSPDQTNAWVSAHAQDADHWIMSLKSPAWPLPVETALAEQGAILFHSKDLWSANLNNPVPKPEGGNGSCASCHGAYSPRYVNDPAYLETPALEGVAAHISPKNIIGTDPVRVDAFNEGTQEGLSNTYVGYPETAGTDQDCGLQNRAALRGARQPGYLAPPLYGVWATSPYFHNGSVPNVWEVLKAADRQPIWRRVSKPARADQQGIVIMGYDTDLRRAYDTQKLGWNYEALACGTGTLPYLECDPADPQADPLLPLSLLYRNLLLGWNLSGPPILTQQQIEDRKIYNTHMFSQGNQGHAFTQVLTDPERKALIEYLKTL
jgi:hypothetical protein